MPPLLRSALLLLQLIAARGDDGPPRYQSRETLLAALDPANIEPNDVAGVIKAASLELRGEKDVMLAAIRSAESHMVNVLKLAPESLLADRDFVYELITSEYGQHHAILKHVAPTVAADHEVVTAAVKRSCWAFRWASDELKANRELAMMAVSQKGCGALLGSVSKSLVGRAGSADTDLVLTAVNTSCDALEYVEELETDRDLMLAAVRLNGDCIEHLSDELKADREIVAEAVSAPGYQLRYAADELQSDKGLIIGELVGSGDRSYGILGMLDKELRHARDIITVAVKEHGHCLKFASDELKDDEDLVLVAVEQNGDALRHASKRLRSSSRSLGMYALRSDDADAFQLLKQFSAELRSDRELVMIAVERDGSCLLHASDELRNDKQVVLAAVAQKGIALAYASAELQNDKEVVLRALATDPDENPERVLKHVSTSMRAEVLGAQPNRMKALFESKQFAIPRKVKLYERVRLPSSKPAGAIMYTTEGLDSPRRAFRSVQHWCDVLCVQVSPSSKRVGQLAKGDIVTVLEEAKWEGEEYVRCEEGWLSVNSPSGKANLRPVKDEL